MATQSQNTLPFCKLNPQLTQGLTKTVLHCCVKRKPESSRMCTFMCFFMQQHANYLQALQLLTEHLKKTWKTVMVAWLSPLFNACQPVMVQSAVFCWLYTHEEWQLSGSFVRWKRIRGQNKQKGKKKKKKTIVKVNHWNRFLSERSTWCNGEVGEAPTIGKKSWTTGWTASVFKFVEGKKSNDPLMMVTEKQQHRVRRTLKP